MAADFTPGIPNLSIDALMSPHLDHGSQREMYRRYRRRTSSAGLSTNEEEESSPYSHKKMYVEQPDAVKQELFFDGDDNQNLADSLNRWETTKPSAAGLEFPRRHIPVKSLHEDQTLKPILPSLKAVKQEPEEISDSGESSFSRFASALNSALQGLMSFPDLVLQFEACCEDLAEHVREEASERHRAIEDHLLRQKAEMLIGESATWALIWHLFGKGSPEMDVENEHLSTSQHEACAFIVRHTTAQLCFRIVQWLERSAAKALDLKKKHKGWYAGSYLQKVGVWHQTQRTIRKMAGSAMLVQHLDPDAPTREQSHLEREDQKLEEGLLEDIWKLILAGRLKEARQLCRSAGQPWRAATLFGCGDIGPFPSPDVLRGKRQDLSLQAVELESGVGHQRHLWKWTCFCASERIAENPDESRYEAAIYASQCGNIKRMLPVCRDWESACWAMVKSWLEVQVDVELAGLHRATVDQMKLNGDTADISEQIVEFNVPAIKGLELWPQHVLDQQPHDFGSLFQKLQSGDLVHESVNRSCKDQQRQIQMCMMVGDVGRLLDLLKTWVVSSDDPINLSRPHGHPQMIRFGAHLVLVLRHILGDDAKEQFREKLWLVGDLILNTYAIFLFTQRREELVGIYAAQLAPYLCEELYLHMMELRQNDSVLVKYKIFRSALESLPFSADDPIKGCVSNILNRLLVRSREVRREFQPFKVEEVADYFQQPSLRKANVVQWLCFASPSSLPNADYLQEQLLTRALLHSNILLREFALISLWRNFKMPVGAHMLIGFLVEPLKQPIEPAEFDQQTVQDNVDEFQQWREYFSCDALYRNWLKMEMSNAQIPSLSFEERDIAVSAANQAFVSTTSLLQRKRYSWMAGPDFSNEHLLSTEWMELHAVALLNSPSGNCLVPDPTICTALRSALYSCVGEKTAMLRQLKVEISVNGLDENLVNVYLKCLPVRGDGISPNSGSDGGLLAAVMATAVKGELDHFQIGVALEVSRLDAWLIDKDGNLTPASYIVRGLCRRCCVPELILRWMQMRVALVDSEVLNEEEDILESIASLKHELHRLFSQRQLQEFLMLEREHTLQVMELAEKAQFNL